MRFLSIYLSRRHFPYIVTHGELPTLNNLGKSKISKRIRESKSIISKTRGCGMSIILSIQEDKG